MKFTKEELQIIEMSLYYQSFNYWTLIQKNNDKLKDLTDIIQIDNLKKLNSDLEKKILKLDILKNKILKEI